MIQTLCSCSFTCVSQTPLINLKSSSEFSQQLPDLLFINTLKDHHDLKADADLSMTTKAFSSVQVSASTLFLSIDFPFSCREENEKQFTLSPHSSPWWITPSLSQFVSVAPRSLYSSALWSSLPRPFASSIAPLFSFIARALPLTYAFSFVFAPLLTYASLLIYGPWIHYAAQAFQQALHALFLTFQSSSVSLSDRTQRINSSWVCPSWFQSFAQECQNRLSLSRLQSFR